VDGLGERLFGSVVDPATGNICRISLDEDGENQITCDPVSRFRDDFIADSIPRPRTNILTRGNDTVVPMYVKNQIADKKAGRLSRFNDLGSNIDILVVWTRKAECLLSGYPDGCSLNARTTANMRGLIRLAMLETNQAFNNSGIATQLRLVHSYRDDTYMEATTNSFLTAIKDLWGVRDGKLDSVHINRRIYGADLVHMIVGSTENCGVAIPASSRLLQQSEMFSLSSYACATGYYCKWSLQV
jgi:hypothetical protein